MLAKYDLKQVQSVSAGAGSFYVWVGVFGSLSLCEVMATIFALFVSTDINVNFPLELLKAVAL